MGVYTTEIASEIIPSDNPIHQRLYKAYVVAEKYVKNDLLEVGCGEGRGIEKLKDQVSSYYAIDKIKHVIDKLREKYPDVHFIHTNIPPFDGLKDNQFDVAISFQVIEHIKKDKEFLKEIYRILKPGGVALLTTPNIKLTLTRNPWHVREYTAEQLTSLSEGIFDRVEMKGITGNEKVMKYYEENKRAVSKITRYDILKLQYKLPAALLRLPYDILNRLNRKKLQKGDTDLVLSINHDDYLLTDNADEALDLFMLAYKK